MIYILIVSLIWAFSFGLIKGNLNTIDPVFVSFARLFLSLLVFIPFLKVKSFKNEINEDKSFLWKLLACGALEYGMMYITYIYSFRYLQAWEVALFTVLTPVYVTLIDDILEKRFNRIYLLTAVLAVAGTIIIEYKDMDRQGLMTGFLIVQISNLCFAFGQIYYRRIMKSHPAMNDAGIFAWLYLGAVILTGLFSLISVDYTKLSLSGTQILTLLYLGIVASGFCFFLWNAGARKTDAGKLAVLNNLKVPLSVMVSVFIFGESGSIVRLATGGAIVVLALFLPDIYQRVRRI